MKLHKPSSLTEAEFSRKRLTYSNFYISTNTKTSRENYVKKKMNREFTISNKYIKNKS